MRLYLFHFDPFVIQLVSMRLLHTTKLELVSFIGTPIEQRPRYAILSHTWKDDEFLFEEARNGIHQHLKNPRRGLRKILNACDIARQDKLDYIWVDTCCIDKSSSAELSEAINSMFKWYKQSASCYVFIDDVTFQRDGTMRDFDKSRWFTRGWTLQELIAPHGLIFFDRDWKYMCSRDEIASWLEEITGVTQSILRRTHIFPPPETSLWHHNRSKCPGCGHIDEVKTDLAEEPISRKMTWAAKRNTTRPEDASYCLLGLFDINMPLLYGEGENAFWRLQEEILKKCPDQSILTWTTRNTEELHRPYLPKMLSAFEFAAQRPENVLIERGDILATPRGLEIDVLFGPCDTTDNPLWGAMVKPQEFMAILSCAVAQDHLPRVAIFVQPLTRGASNTAYTRVRNDSLIQLHPGAEPLILRTVLGGGLCESKDAAVAYDPQELSPKRILLAAIRPKAVLSSQRPEVYIVGPEIQKLKLNTKERMNLHGVMIPYQEPSDDGDITESGYLDIRGVWHLENGTSGFVLLWGVPGAFPNGHCVAWVETLGSFFQEKPASIGFERALLEYMERQRPALVLPANDISEPGLEVNVSVDMAGFLGRKTYTIVLDIDGWDDHPVSMVKYLEVESDDWS